MRERTLRRMCRRLARGLDLTLPLDVQRLCQGLGESRGRPIELVCEALPPAVFGFCWASTERDYIFYQRHTTRLHQDHIVLHEVGHILAGHIQPSDDGDLANLASLLSRGSAPPPACARLVASPGAPSRVLYRSRYDTRQEWEAETIATILRERAMVHEQVFGTAPPDPAVQTLDGALRSARGWL